MSKNIVICSDGTGNSGGKGSVTNVWRIFEAINRASSETEQVAFYDDGVGTESFKPLRLLGGAFGVGLARNVKQLYTEICRIYEPGDKLFFFGFSRGAFTVRTLLGWIMEVGLIDPSGCNDSKELEKLVDKSYKALRAQFRTIPQRVFISDSAASKRKQRLAANLFKLTDEQTRSLGHFIGVWDTVDAVGFPVAFLASFWNSWIHQFKFPNHYLNKNVRTAYHALAIDDERLTFHPQPWDEGRLQEDQDLKQIWFAGMHSNVGGGYPQDGMAYVSLAWIMDAAVGAGMKFTESLETLYRERANPLEKMYNSRSGAGAYYRFSPRNLGTICTKYNIKETVIHPSVRVRTQQSPAGYTPRHLPSELGIWSGKHSNTQGDAAFQTALKNMKIADVANVSAMWDKLRSGLQWFVVGFSLVFALAAGTYGLFPDNMVVDYIAKIIAGNAPNVNWATLTIQSGVLLVLTFLLAKIAEKNSHRQRSRFWTSILRQNSVSDTDHVPNDVKRAEE